MKKKMLYISIISVAVGLAAILLYCLEVFDDIKGLLFKKYSRI